MQGEWDEPQRKPLETSRGQVRTWAMPPQNPKPSSANSWTSKEQLKHSSLSPEQAGKIHLNFQGLRCCKAPLRISGALAPKDCKIFAFVELPQGVDATGAIAVMKHAAPWDSARLRGWATYELGRLGLEACWDEGNPNVDKFCVCFVPLCTPWPWPAVLDRNSCRKTLTQVSLPRRVG